MKILYHHRIASKDGQYVHVEEIINALKTLGHEVVTVAPRVSEQASFGGDGGWMSKLRTALPKFASELLEFGYAFYAFAKLSLAIVKHRPDVIYERYNLLFPAGIWAKKCFDLPLILEVNSPLFDERSAYGGLALPRLARWSEHYTWQHADHVLPVTHVLADFVRKAGVDDARVSVVANGVNLAHFAPNLQVIRQPQFAGKLVLGFVGFCREWHQLDRVLALIAAAKSHNILLLIVGDGPASDSLRQKAAALSIEDRLYITGVVERDAMPAWLDQIDVALQPAVTPWSSPLKLIEYLAKGKVIVAPNSRNILELLSHEQNALLYDPDCENALLLAIERVMQDEGLRTRLAQNALRTIDNKQLTWKQNAERIAALFASLQDKDVPKAQQT